MARLKFYSIMLTALNGHIQHEQQKVDVRQSGSKVRVYMRSAVSIDGIEFDGAPYLGTDKTVRVNVVRTTRVPGPLNDEEFNSAESIVCRDMRLMHFAMSGSIDREPACARYIFECEAVERKTDAGFEFDAGPAMAGLKPVVAFAFKDQATDTCAAIDSVTRAQIDATTRLEAVTLDAKRNHFGYTPSDLKR